MEKDTKKTIESLIIKGQLLSSRKDGGFVKAEQISQCQEWFSDILNYIRNLTSENSYYFREAERIIKGSKRIGGICWNEVEMMKGHLNALSKEIEEGTIFDNKHHGKKDGLSRYHLFIRHIRKFLKSIWFLVLLVIIILIIFYRQLDWSQIFDLKYWIDKKLNLPFKETAQNESSLKMIGIGFIPNTSNIVIRLENSGKSDISAGMTVRLALVPFRGNDIMEENISWIKAKNEAGIGAGESQSYIFEISPEQKKLSVVQATFIAIIVQSDQLRDGIASDIGYTWDSGQTWALLRTNSGHVDINQNNRIQSFVDKIRICVKEHLKDKEYAHCFDK